MYAFLLLLVNAHLLTDVHYASFIYNPYSIVKEVVDHEDRRCLAPTTGDAAPPVLTARKRAISSQPLPASLYSDEPVSPRARACGREGRGAPQTAAKKISSQAPPSREILDTLSPQVSLPASGLFPGGAERDRTDDLLSANQALSQLSYSPGKVQQGLDEWLSAEHCSPTPWGPSTQGSNLNVIRQALGGPR
jgi:hypothetical protein